MAGRVVYVACADLREIVVYAMDPRTGSLTPRGVVAIPGLAEPSPTSPLAVSPDRRFLYAGLRVPPYPVASYAIDPADGGLRLLGTGALPQSMAALTTDRTGRWLLGASYGGAVVSASPIDADGVVRRPAARVAATPPKAHCVLVAPDNRFVYAACLGGDALLIWDFDPTSGLAAPEAPRRIDVRAGAGPRHLAFSPDGATLYAVNELDGTLDVFARDADGGGLVHRQTIATLAVPAPGDAAAADIHATPDGRFVYASIRRDSVIAAFAVSADGRLAAIDRVPVEATPRSFAIDPDGRFLVCAGRDAACCGVYAIDAASGRLSRVAGVETSSNPNWVEIIDLA